MKIDLSPTQTIIYSFLFGFFLMAAFMPITGCLSRREYLATRQHDMAQLRFELEQIHIAVRNK